MVEHIHLGYEYWYDTVYPVSLQTLPSGLADLWVYLCMVIIINEIARVVPVRLACAKTSCNKFRVWQPLVWLTTPGCLHTQYQAWQPTLTPLILQVVVVPNTPRIWWTPQDSEHHGHTNITAINKPHNPVENTIACCTARLVYAYTYVYVYKGKLYILRAPSPWSYSESLGPLDSYRMCKYMKMSI